MKVIAARRSAADLASPYSIVSYDGAGVETVVANPPKGRSFTRPVVAPPGRLAWWEVEVGGSHDSPWSMFGARWWVDGKRQPRPTTWLACGHLEWHPDGKQMTAAVWEWWTKDFRPFTFDGSAWKPSGPFGMYDPGYSPTGDLTCAAKLDVGHGVNVGGRTICVPGGQTFDPVVSPDGARLAVLVMESMTPARWRIDVVNLVTGVRVTVLAAENHALNSAPRWIDNDRLLVCRCLPVDAFTWRPWVVPLTGPPTPLWDTKRAQVIGSVEYAVPMP